MRRFPVVTVLLAVSLVAAYGVELAGGGYPICERFGLVPSHPELGAAISSTFLHDPSSLFHLGGNVIFLIVFGSLVERALGSLRFLGLYAAAGLGGAALHVLVNVGSSTPMVGCSGCLCGLLAVAAVIRPRLIGFAGAFIALQVWYSLSGGAGNISFGDHIGGFAIGVLVAMFLRATGDEALEAA